ncbi:polysaccharide deacetylase family protein [Micromonospora zhanjiangensis]
MSLYQGGNYRPGNYRNRWGSLRLTPGARNTLLVVLIAGSTLFTAYAVGRTLGTSGGVPSGTPVAARSDADRAGPARTSPAPARPTPQAPDRYAEAQPRPERGGPFGSRISTGSDRVALTFDDGPSPEYTPQILAVLRQYGVKATFCIIGRNARDYPELVRQVAAEGHTLCNHSWSHDVTLGSRTAAAIRADLTATDEAIHAAAPDATIRYFRQPGGAWTPVVVDVARQLGMTSLAWSVDPRDWTRPGVAAIVSAVLDPVDAGSIVLMHDGGGTRQGSVDALRVILASLTQRFQLESLPTGLAAAAYQRAPVANAGPR